MTTTAKIRPMAKAPAYQHYAKDWLADTAHLTLEEQGAYMRLLDHQWVEGPLCAQDEELARRLGVGRKRFAAIWRTLVRFFPPCPARPSHVANERLEVVRLAQDEYRRQQSERGRRGAESRWNEDGTRHGTGKALAMPAPRPDDGSSSSSASESKDTLRGADAPVEQGIGAFYGERLRRLLWVRPHRDHTKQRENESRDISVLKRQLNGRDREEVVLAVAEARRAADAGELPGWIGPGDNFALYALLADSNGGIATFERFRHAALKRGEQSHGNGRRAPVPAGAVLSGAASGG